jgi:hypothetical protein
LIIRSLAATPVESESASPVTVVIAIPVEKAIPVSEKTLAADVGGITIEK